MPDPLEEDAEFIAAARKRRALYIGVGIFAVLVVVLLSLFFTAVGLDQADRLASVITSIVGVLGIVVGSCVFLSSTLRNRQEVRNVERARQDLQRVETSLGEAERLTLPALWEATHRRLDYYHQIATSQARHSFRNAQTAMAIGFVLLVAFAILSLNASNTTASIVTGALGAASAGFAAYISRTFVRSQEAAANHLRAYFDQPLEFSRYLAAERLLDAMDKLEPEQRATIAATLMQAIVATAGGSPNTSSSGDGSG